MKKKTVKKQVVKLTEKELTKVVGGRGTAYMGTSKLYKGLKGAVGKWFRGRW